MRIKVRAELITDWEKTITAETIGLSLIDGKRRLQTVQQHVVAAQIASSPGGFGGPERAQRQGHVGLEAYTRLCYMKQGKPMATPIAQRVQKHRAGLRRAGMRPVQLWVPDTRTQQFSRECQRQCLLVAQADAADAEISDVLDAALKDLEGWHA